MKTGIISNILVALSGLVYAFLFWHESMGLNTLLYSAFLLVALTLLHPGVWQSHRVIVIGAATVFSTLLVVVHHSFLAKFTHVVTLILFIGFVQARELRFIWYAFLVGLSGLFTGPLGHSQSFQSAGINKPRMRAFAYWFKLILLPLFLGVLFFLIYYQANSHFADIITRIWKSISQVFRWRWSFSQVLLFLFGAVVMMSLIWPSLGIHYFKRKDKNHPLNLARTRSKTSSIWGMNALSQEYLRAKLTIGLLNGLLFIVNVTDLRYAWVEYEATTANQLQKYVHEGTYLLILSILMAMFVLIYFFRKNLNFFPNNQRLIDLANLWILQNGLLVLSVGYRNYQYIDKYGLAYKRLAVIFFLLLVLFGLFTLFLKIKHKRSLFYLFLLNGWALYATFLMTSAVNWDLMITRYNIQEKFEGRIDIYFLGPQMSDKNLFILEKHKERIAGPTDNGLATFEGTLSEKRQRLKSRTENLSWKSWNLIDWRNKQYLKSD